MKDPRDTASVASDAIDITASPWGQVDPAIPPHPVDLMTLRRMRDGHLAIFVGEVEVAGVLAVAAVDDNKEAEEPVVVVTLSTAAVRFDTEQPTLQ